MRRGVQCSDRPSTIDLQTQSMTETESGGVGCRCDEDLRRRSLL